MRNRDDRIFLQWDFDIGNNKSATFTPENIGDSYDFVNGYLGDLGYFRDFKGYTYIPVFMIPLGKSPEYSLAIFLFLFT